MYNLLHIRSLVVALYCTTCVLTSGTQKFHSHLPHLAMELSIQVSSKTKCWLQIKISLYLHVFDEMGGTLAIFCGILDELWKYSCLCVVPRPILIDMETWFHCPYTSWYYKWNTIKALVWGLQNLNHVYSQNQLGYC